MTKSARSAAAPEDMDSIPFFHHRSSLKQKNKPFKGHGLNGSVKTGPAALVTKGKTAKSTLAPVLPSKQHRPLNKAERKNRTKIAQKLALAKLKEQRTLFKSMPMQVALMPLTTSVAANVIRGDLINLLPKEGFQFQLADEQSMTPIDAVTRIINGAEIVAFLITPQDLLDSDQSFTVEEDEDEMMTMITSITSVHHQRHAFYASKLTEWAKQVLDILRSLGMPTGVIFTLTPASEESLILSSQLKKKRLHGLAKYVSGSDSTQLTFFHLPHDRLAFQRWSREVKLNSPSWRQHRPYFIIEHVENGDQGQFTVKGHVRGGMSWRSDQRVHLTGVGDFICHVLDQDVTMVNEVDDEDAVDDVFSPLELNEEPSSNTTTKTQALNKKISVGKTVSVKVPEGTSSYQAAWYVGEDTEDSESTSEEDSDEIMEQNEELEDNVQSMEDIESIDENIDENDEEIEEEVEERIKKLIPDAVPLPPPGSTAMSQFADYRGLSEIFMKKAEWQQEPGEIPLHMNRLFRFADPKASKQAAWAWQSKGFHHRPGTCLTMTLTPVRQISNVTIQVGCVLWGLLKHEHLPACLNVVLNMNRNIQDISVDLNLGHQMTVLVDGFRMYQVSPLLSEPGNDMVNRQLSNQEILTSSNFMATFIGPMSHAPCSVLAFDPKNLRYFFAQGTLQDCNPDRIVLKRVTMVGKPFRIHHRLVTIRGMFTNPADVHYFMPVPLYTVPRGSRSINYRIRGHLVDSIGEHGKCKASFERQIQADDLICLSLYRRQWPSWSAKIN